MIDRTLHSFTRKKYIFTCRTIDYYFQILLIQLSFLLIFTLLFHKNLISHESHELQIIARCL